jgi:hypothetical protein
MASFEELGGPNRLLILPIYGMAVAYIIGEYQDTFSS